LQVIDIDIVLFLVIPSLLIVSLQVILSCWSPSLASMPMSKSPIYAPPFRWTTSELWLLSLG